MAATPPPRDLAEELSTSLSALLLALQRLRTLQGGGEKDRALALLDRMETAVRGMSALLESLSPPPGPDTSS